MAERRLPNDAIVLRGGELYFPDVEEQAEDEYRRCATYTISVNCDAGLSLADLAAKARRPNRKIRKTTVGALRAWGFDIAPPKGARAHANLIMARQRSLTEKDWRVLDNIFGPAEGNPVA